MSQTGGFFRTLRMLHRWVSMTFVVFAILTLLPIIPQGPAYGVVAALTIAQLLFLIISGVAMAIRHFVLKGRRRVVVS